MQNLTSAKRFFQSRLDFLPELGYVYICHSILKPSNYLLSCTPSHTLTFIWCVLLHQWKLAQHPHPLHMNQYSHWHANSNTPSISDSLCLSVVDNLAFCTLWWYAHLIGWGLLLRLFVFFSEMRFIVFVCFDLLGYVVTSFDKCWSEVFYPSTWAATLPLCPSKNKQKNRLSGWAFGIDNHFMLWTNLSNL